MMSALRAYIKYPVTYKILIAFIIAIPIGYVLGGAAAPLGYLGTVFIRLMKLAMVLVVFSMITSAIAEIRAGLVVGKAMFLIVVLYMVASFLASLAATFFGHHIAHVGAGVTLKPPTVTPPPPPSIETYIASFVPDNPVGPLVRFEIINILIIAAFLGVATYVLKREPATSEIGEFLARLWKGLAEISKKILRGFLEYAPFGIFGLTASLVGTYKAAVLGELLYYFVVQVAVLLFWCFVAYPIMLLAAGINPLRFYKLAWPATLTAFSTRSSAATLPVTLDCGERIGLPRDIASVALPLGAVIHMDGSSINITFGGIFSAGFSGIILAPWQIVTLAVLATGLAAGLAPVPGVGGITAPAVAAGINVPLEPMFLVAPIFYLLDPFVTMNNVTGDLVCSAIAAKVLRLGNVDKIVGLRRGA
jgi:Na+/H+-dicarboxylate symporter